MRRALRHGASVQLGVARSLKGDYKARVLKELPKGFWNWFSMPRVEYFMALPSGLLRCSP